MGNEFSCVMGISGESLVLAKVIKLSNVTYPNVATVGIPFLGKGLKNNPSESSMQVSSNAWQ